MNEDDLRVVRPEASSVLDLQECQAQLAHPAQGESTPEGESPRQRRL